MPVYEYKCKECGKEYDLLQKADASKTDKCEDCGGLAKRVISGFSAHVRDRNYKEGENRIQLYALGRECPVHPGNVQITHIVAEVKNYRQRRSNVSLN